MGIALLEITKTGQNPKCGYPDARRDGHRRVLVRAGEGAGGILKLLHHAVGDPEQTLAFGREADRAIAPIQELDADGFLQRANLTADGGLREEQVLGRKRDAHASTNRNETADEIQRWQSDWKF